MRPFSTIRQLIRNAFATSPVLRDLDINNPASVEYNLIETAAGTHMVLEQIWVVKQAEIQAQADAAIHYVAPWYVAMTKLFQYGDQLVWDAVTYRFKYAAIVPELRIVAQAVAMRVSSGNVLIKCAKLINGALAPLTVQEQAALTAYWQAIKPLGRGGVAIRSAQPDVVRFGLCRVYYDALVPFGTIEAAVIAAVNQYLSYLQFGGKIRVSEIIAAIKSVPGVVDVQELQLKVSSNGGPFVILSEAEYVTYAGYASFDAGHSLIYYEIDGGLF